MLRVTVVCAIVSFPLLAAVVAGSVVRIEEPAGAQETPGEAGVVVEEVPEGTVLWDAGIRPGDVLLAWERLPNLPANPDGATGKFGSIFDWRWVEVEQRPRGTLRLRGKRGDQPKSFVVVPGMWKEEIRPALPSAALHLYLEGKARLEAGDTTAADLLWQRAAMLPQVGWHQRCWLLLAIGEIRETESSQEAHGAFRSALSEARTPGARASILRKIGWSHFRQRQYPEAREAFETAQRIRAKLWGESLILAEMSLDLGTLWEWQGQLVEAESHYRRSLDIRRKLAPESLATAENLNNLGVVVGRQGRPDEAEELHRHALDIVESHPATDLLAVARLLNNLGTLAWFRGRLEEAERYDRRALAIRQERFPESPDFATSLHDIALVAWARGDLETAEEHLERALTLREKLDPEGLDTANSLHSLGLLALSRNQLDLAESYFRRSLDLRHKRGSSSRAAYSLDSLGVVALRRGELDAAEHHFQLALTLREKVAAPESEMALSLFRLGSLALERGDLPLAEGLLRRALTLCRQVAPGGMEEATTLSALGEVAAQQHDVGLAIELHTRALGIRQRLAPGSTAEARSLHALGQLYQERGDARATDFFHRAVQALERQIAQVSSNRETEASFRAWQRAIYRDAIGSLVDEREPAKALQLLETYRGRSMLEMLAERDLVFAAEVPKDLESRRRSLSVRYDRVYRKLSKLSPATDGAEIENLLGELRRLRAEAEGIREEIRRRSPALTSLQYPEPLTLQGVRRALDPGTLLLSYSIGEEGTDLFVVDREEGLTVATLPVGEEQLRRQVGELRELITRALPGDATGAQQSLIALGKTLYRTLIQPVAGRVETSDRLLILPDGPLHLLPWGALIRSIEDHGDTEGWQYLIEWKPIHTALSATVYAELKRQRPHLRQEGGSHQIQIAAFGDPHYPGRLTGGEADDISDVRVRSAVQRGLFDWQPLPATRREVEGVVGLFPQAAARAFLGAEATEEAAKAVGSEPRILHFATHGLLDDRFPLNSALVLSIPEEFEEGQDNGLLQVWEIFERVRIDADLVVLSACASALGQELGGEGLIGLTRAFQYAGARSVAASLWNVRDDATAELMVRFYRHLRAGLPKNEALREAQMELIRGPNRVDEGGGTVVEKDRSAPFYWAAFQLYGDWR